MRRFLLLGVFLLAASLSFAVPISAGVLVAWTPLEGDYQTVLLSGSPLNANYAFEALGVKAFVDFTYAEASIGLDTSVTNINVTATYLGTTVSQNLPWSATTVNIRLLGKYPFDLDFGTLFPLFGLEKYFCLGGSYNNVSFTSDSRSDDSPWLLMAGIGYDRKITQKIYIRAEATVAYNLTSERSSSYYTGTTYQSSTGWEIQIAAGIGFFL
jgi:hypothetical protein